MTMPGKRELAARALSLGGLVQALGAMRSAVFRDLRVLAYHRVLPDLDEERYPGDIELVSALQPEFDWQMAYVAHRFRPVTCEQVISALDGGAPLPRRAVMVTFDDGFCDNFHLAWPVLQRHRLPAIFFLATDFLDRQVPFWFDRLVQLLLLLRNDRLHLEALDQTLEPSSSVATRRMQAANLLRQLKRVPDAVRCSVMQELERQANAAGVGGAPSADPLASPLQWQQVREMARDGMEFGSHTVTHPVLTRLGGAAPLARELGLSRQRIAHETGRSVTALAYPVGGRDAVDEQVLQATAEAGYRLAFTYQPGVNRMPAPPRLMLKRLHVERYTTRALFAAALELPVQFGR